MKVNELDRTVLKAITDDIMLALAPVAAKYEMSITYKGAQFSPQSAVFKIEAATIADSVAGPVANTRERQDFVKYASLYGMSPDDIDKEFDYGRKTFRIVGLRTKSNKSPIMAMQVDTGKVYKFPAVLVAREVSPLGRKAILP